MPADRSYEAGPSRPRSRPHPADAHGKKKSYKTAKPKAPSNASSFPEKHKPQALEYRTPDGLPGVNKIKASIRQTNRFLNKPDLEPGRKIQAQRRLESLQADLAKAERRDTEKKIGAKYHMVKFFERKKLLRIIKRQNKHIKKAQDTGDSKTVVKAEETLRQARIMLNYIVHFSKSEKYISLFPPEHTAPEDADPAEDEDGDKKIRLPPHLSPNMQINEGDVSAKRRLEVLKQVEALMLDGKLPAKPDDEKHDDKSAAALSAVDLGGRASAAGAAGAAKKGKAGREEKEKVEDDFFDSE